MSFRLSTNNLSRFWSKVHKTTDCWFWTGKLSRGYGWLWIRGSGYVRAHRLAWEIHNGTIPDGLNVLHTCDNPPCVRPDHLFLGTQQDNISDMIKKGRARPFGGHGGHGHGHGKNQKGEANYNVRIREQDAREIFSMNGLHREIAALFGISKQQVARIKSRQRWAHVNPAAFLAAQLP